MAIYRKENHVFKKGEVYDLDQVYPFFGLFPYDSERPYYETDDPLNWTISNGNDGGESVRILRDFTIQFSIKVYK